MRVTNQTHSLSKVYPSWVKIWKFHNKACCNNEAGRNCVYNLCTRKMTGTTSRGKGNKKQEQLFLDKWCISCGKMCYLNICIYIKPNRKWVKSRCFWKSMARPHWLQWDQDFTHRTYLKNAASAAHSVWAWLGTCQWDVIMKMVVPRGDL